MVWSNWFFKELCIRLSYYLFFCLYIICLFVCFRGEILVFFMKLYLNSFFGQPLLLFGGSNLFESQFVLCVSLVLGVGFIQFLLITFHYLICSFYKSEVFFLFVLFSSYCFLFFFKLYFEFGFIGVLYYNFSFLFYPGTVSQSYLLVSFGLVDYCRFIVFYFFISSFFYTLFFCFFCFVFYARVNLGSLFYFRLIIFFFHVFFIFFIFPPDGFLHFAFFCFFVFFWELVFFLLSIFKEYGLVIDQ